MQEKDRKRIFNVLFGHMKRNKANADAYKILADFVAEDLRAIEPIVDAIVRRALTDQTKKLSQRVVRLLRGRNGSNHHVA